ncbi:hypothetical protein Bbelb_404130, partial [Branchiostoma belcheri]
HAEGQGQLYQGEVQGIPCLSCDADIIDGVLEDNPCAGTPATWTILSTVMYKTADRVLTDITRGCEQTCTETDDCMRDASGDCVRCCNDRNNNTACNTWVIDRENIRSGGVRVGEAALTSLLALALMFGYMYDKKKWKLTKEVEACCPMCHSAQEELRSKKSGALVHCATRTRRAKRGATNRI